MGTPAHIKIIILQIVQGVYALDISDKVVVFIKKKMINAALLCLSAALIICAASINRSPHVATAPSFNKSDFREYASPALPIEFAAKMLLSGMTDYEKAWQMLFVFPESISGSATSTDLELWASSMAKYPAGGFVIGGESMQSEHQLKNLLACLGSAADIAAFIGVDEEGGQVARVSYNLGIITDFSPMYTYKEKGTEAAYSNARTIGSELRELGFNLNFAPVADVWTNSKNTVIAQRAYSDDPTEAAALVAAAVSGFSDAGIISVLKHFPGHGDTHEDSHFAAAFSDKTLIELHEGELLPFRSGLDAGADMVMLGHIILPELDPDTPATISKYIVTDLLRGELGFDGVIITDSMQMAAIDLGNEAETCIAAIEAGVDIILAPFDPQAVVEAILSSISSERLDESVYRILMLKLRWGLI